MPRLASLRRTPNGVDRTERTAVLAELDRIAASPAFGGSPRQIRLLRFLVGEVLEGRGEELRAPIIATRVFERPEGFNSAEDSLVRVEMSKLRRALDRHYAVDHTASLRIRLPRGSCAPLLVQAGEVSTGGPDSKGPASDDFLTGADGPVLAVLPFAGLTAVSTAAFRATRPDERGAEHGAPGTRGQTFGRGLTARIGAVCAHFPWVSVVSRAATIDEAKARGARYVLEGSVRLVSGALRATATLHDARRGLQVWGKAYDRTADDAGLFAVEDEIAHALAAELVATPFGVIHAIEARERSGRAAQSDYDAILRFPRWLTTFDGRLQAEILGACERALAVAPDRGVLLGFLSILHSLASWTSSGSPHDRRRAAELARHAVRLEPTFTAPHHALAYVLLDAGNGPGVIAEAEAGLAIGGEASVSGFLLTLAGAWDRGAELLRADMRWTKRHPGLLHHALALDAYRRGDHAAALAEAEAIATPALAWDPLDRAIALARLGRLYEARAAGRELVAILPDAARDPRALAARITPDLAVREAIVEGLKLAGIG